MVELLIVLAIFTIVAVFSFPFLQTFQTSSDLYTHADSITRTLRRAQHQAMSGQDGSSWGVYFDSGNDKFILFKGEDYATRDPEYDLETEYSEIFDVTTTFGQEVYFSVYSGTSSTGAATTTMTDTVSNNSKDIVISNFGVIENK